MFNSISSSIIARVLVACASVFGLLVSQQILADDPPIAFSEQIVVQIQDSRPTSVSVPLLHFDPQGDPNVQPGDRVLSQILEFPANLPLAGGSAGQQSCAFFGSCGFFVANFFGTDRLTFVITSAGEDALVSEPAVTTIEVIENTGNLIAFNQQAGTYPNTPVAIRPGGRGLQEIEALTYSVVSPPQHGALSLSTADVRSPVVYTPDSGFVGVDRFGFTVTDGVTVSEPAGVAILVGVSDVPVATAITPSTGSVAGGDEVTIAGFDLPASGVQVAFGDEVVATGVTVIGNSKIMVTTPANTAGAVDVRVTTPQGVSVLPNAFTYEAPAPGSSGLVSAVLPAARSVQVGTDATAFGVMVNSSDVALQDCGIAPVTALDAGFAFQTTDALTNALTGAENAPVDVPAQGVQTFVFRVTPNSATLPTDIELAFQCAGGARAASSPGVNTLLFSASDQPIPDVIALVAVDSGSAPAGTLSLESPGNQAFFAVATTNVGAPGTLEVETDTPLPLTVSVCEVAEDCFANGADRITVDMAGNSVGSYFFLVEASEEIPFLPATSRIFVRFRDAQGIIRGSTSVAVTTD